MHVLLSKNLCENITASCPRVYTLLVRRHFTTIFSIFMRWNRSWTQFSSVNLLTFYFYRVNEWFMFIYRGIYDTIQYIKYKLHYIRLSVRYLVKITINNKWGKQWQMNISAMDTTRNDNFKFTCSFSSLCDDFTTGDPTQDGGVVRRSQYEPSKNIIPDGLDEFSFS